MGVPIVDNVGLKVRQKSTIDLSTLQRLYKAPGLDPTALVFLYFLSLRLPADFKLFIISLMRFS